MLNMLLALAIGSIGLEVASLGEDAASDGPEEADESYDEAERTATLARWKAAMEKRALTGAMRGLRDDRRELRDGPMHDFCSQIARLPQPDFDLLPDGACCAAAACGGGRGAYTFDIAARNTNISGAGANKVMANAREAGMQAEMTAMACATGKFRFLQTVERTYSKRLRELTESMAAVIDAKGTSLRDCSAEDRNQILAALEMARAAKALLDLEIVYSLEEERFDERTYASLEKLVLLAGLDPEEL